MARRFTLLVVAGMVVVACLASRPTPAEGEASACSTNTPDCDGTDGDALCVDAQGMPDPLLDCVPTDPGMCGCRPRVCCNCEGGDATSSCNLPCTQTGIGLLVCVGLCAAIDSSDAPCSLSIVNRATCTDGTCATTGCCTFDESNGQARTVSQNVCVQTDLDTCGLLGNLTLFVPGGSCDGGLFGTCVSPTPTSTPTSTASATNTASVTNTPTITATPTNTPVPNGGECATPAECSSTFCVDGVCCDTPCDQPLEICDDPADPGTCTTVAAQAPAMSNVGLLIGLAVLALVGGLTLMWRPRRTP